MAGTPESETHLSIILPDFLAIGKLIVPDKLFESKGFYTKHKYSFLKILFSICFINSS